MVLNELAPFQHSQTLNEGNSLHLGTFMSCFVVSKRKRIRFCDLLTMSALSTVVYLVLFPV